VAEHRAYNGTCFASAALPSNPKMMDETLAQEVQMSPEAPEMPLVALSAQDLLNSPPQKLAKGCWGILDMHMSKGHLRSFGFEMHNPKGSRCTYRFRIH